MKSSCWCLERPPFFLRPRAVVEVAIRALLSGPASQPWGTQGTEFGNVTGVDSCRFARVPAQLGVELPEAGVLGLRTSL